MCKPFLTLLSPFPLPLPFHLPSLPFVLPFPPLPSPPLPSPLPHFQDAEIKHLTEEKQSRTWLDLDGRSLASRAASDAGVLSDGCLSDSAMDSSHEGKEGKKKKKWKVSGREVRVRSCDHGCLVVGHHVIARCLSCDLEASKPVHCTACLITSTMQPRVQLLLVISHTCIAKRT